LISSFKLKENWRLTSFLEDQKSVFLLFLTFILAKIFMLKFVRRKLVQLMPKMMLLLQNGLYKIGSWSAYKLQVNPKL
jgi:hypothetical protein